MLLLLLLLLMMLLTRDSCKSIDALVSCMWGLDHDSHGGQTPRMLRGSLIVRVSYHQVRIKPPTPKSLWSVLIDW